MRRWWKTLRQIKCQGIKQNNLIKGVFFSEPFLRHTVSRATKGHWCFFSPFLDKKETRFPESDQDEVLSSLLLTFSFNHNPMENMFQTLKRNLRKKTLGHFKECVTDTSVVCVISSRQVILLFEFTFHL